MIADKYDTVFRGGDLTHLMITKKGDRNKIPKHLTYPIYKLLKAFLENYDIFIGGATHIGDYEVTCVTIGTNFDTDNELVLRQLYDFTSGRVNIQLSLKISEDAAFAFWYDLTDYSCTFEKYFLGATKTSVRYETLKDMLLALEKLEKDKGEN